MAKIDPETMMPRRDDNMVGHEIEKPKNEERNKLLSIAVGDGRSLIAVSEFERIRRASPATPRYSFFVTKPGVDDTHVAIVLDAPDVHALIGILQEIIDEE